MALIEDLRARRKNVYTEAKALANKAATENRAFDHAEENAWHRLNADLDALDERIGEIAEQEQRAEGAAQYFRDLSARPVEHGRMPMSTEDADLDKAFRSAILAKNPAPIDIPVTSRSYYQPGLEQRDLLKTTATQAIPTSTYDQIVSHMVENSAVMRAGATVIQTPTGEDLLVPKSSAFSSSALTGEGAAITESDPTLAAITLRSYKFATFFQISSELARDSNSDLLNFLTRQAGESLALAYGEKLINGSGSGEPTGALTSATTGVTGPTGTATSLGTQGTAGEGTDLLFGLHGSLAEPYAIAPSRAWLLRTASLTTIRQLKDSTGQPVLPADATGFLNAPFLVDPFVPAMAANAESIVYGDWSRYFVRIAEGLRFERSDDFGFQNDLVSFRAIIRLDGALVDASALKTFVNSAT